MRGFSYPHNPIKHNHNYQTKGDFYSASIIYEITNVKFKTTSGVFHYTLGENFYLLIQNIDCHEGIENVY